MYRSSYLSWGFQFDKVANYPKHIGQAHSEFFNKMFFFSQKALDSLPLFLSLLAIGDLIHVRCNLTTSLIQVFFYIFFIYIFLYIYFFWV